MVYAKFIAVHPEDSTRLALLWRKLVAKEGNSLTAHICITQGVIFQMPQELMLSAQLKRKLGNIQKQAACTKRKLRNVWDLVIQGNISEMQSSVASAHSGVQKIGHDFRHLLAQYPTIDSSRAHMPETLAISRWTIPN
jgi:hypothetical protein